MKIRIIETGEIKEVSSGYTIFLNQKGTAWEEVKDKSPLNVAVSDSGLSKEASFMKLSEGDKDLIRKGFKELVLRKAGWILRDCNANRIMEEIHISIPDRTEQIKNAKESAIKRAQIEVDTLKKFKDILKKVVRGEDIYISFGNGTDEELQDLDIIIDRLSCGNSEVESLKSEIEKMRKIKKG